MGQSKLPAKCCECGLVGPPRKKAAKEGWVRKNGPKPKWLCPEHGPEWKREEDRKLQEQMQSAQASRARLALRLAGLAGVGVTGFGPGAPPFR